MRRLGIVAVGLALAGLIAVAGCGGGEEEPTSVGTLAASPVATTEARATATAEPSAPTNTPAPMPTDTPKPPPTNTPPPPPTNTPTLSPEGIRLVEPGVYLIDPSDKTATRLTSGDYDVAPAWSPDGQLIAFARLDAPYATSGAIYLINRDGGNETRLAEGTRPFAWSPDGRIAFRGTSGDLYVVGADGTGLVNLTEGRMRLSEVLGNGLSWSPDGQRIAFVADGSIYVIGDDGGNPTRLQAGEPHLRDMGGIPSWSADGASVLAQAWFTDMPDILALNADGSGATPIAETPASERDAAWSPDGSRLAYWSYIVAPQQAVHVVGVDGTHEATVFESDSPNGFSGNLPSWSADGKHLAFLGEGSILCTVDADGSNLRVLLRVACSDSPAAWSPDGGAIAVSEIPCGE